MNNINKIIRSARGIVILDECYSKGKVTGGEASYGFVGFNAVDDQDYVSCFWDITSSGCALSNRPGAWVTVRQQETEAAAS